MQHNKKNKRHTGGGKKSKTVSAESLVVYEENKEFAKNQLEMVRASLQIQSHYIKLNIYYLVVIKMEIKFLKNSTIKIMKYLGII